MKKALNWGWSILEVVIILYVILITSFVLCKNKYGYTQFGKYTLYSADSKGVEYFLDVHKGDLLIFRGNDSIKEGDTIYYYAVSNENYVVKVDVVSSIKKESSNFVYSLRDDSSITVNSTRVLGEKVCKIGLLGGILNAVEDRYGFLFFVLFPIIIVFIYQVHAFFVTIRHEQENELENKEEKKDIKEIEPKEIEKKSDPLEEEVEELLIDENPQSDDVEII